VPIGGGPPSTDEGVAGEDALDVQTIRSVAPNAQIVDYQVCSSGCAANAQSLAGALALVVNQVVQDGQAKIISASYSLCDMPFAVTSGDRLAMTNALQAAAARGVTYLESTGDRGAFQCQREDPTIITPNVAFPTDLPLTVAVGGTLLSVGTKGEYIAETGWGDTLSHSGGGGGLNPVEPRQPWQTGPGVQSQYSNGHRQLPDVSGPADPDSGFEIVSGGKAQAVGGTSASTPFWAGILALTQQYTAKQGAGALPQMSPVFYQLGSAPQPFPPYHDVVRGNNRFYPATPGWDFATGWGSPDAFNFARDVAAAIKK
jgi:kumamolisin